MKNSEQGITLVISIVMLATVTFVSFALSAIVIREIGAARVVLRSEPAISGANSGGEIGLYRLFRGLGGSSVSGQVSSGGASYQVSTDYYDNPYVFQAASGQEINVALYDAENLDNQTTGYASVTITNDGTNSQPIKNRIVNWSDPEHPVCPEQTTAVGQTRTCSLNSADDRYVIFIQPTGGGTANGNIATTGILPGVPTDSPSLDVTGTGSGVQRKIQIKL